MIGYSIAVDLGGTNARFALIKDGCVDLGTVKKYSNAKFDSFYAVLRTFMSDFGLDTVDAICCAVAGPIEHDYAELTNLSWRLEKWKLAQITQAARVELINDLQAQGYGITHADPEALSQVRVGAPKGNTTRLVIGVGTGLNAAQVFETPNGLFVPAAEAGHVQMPVGNSTRLAALHSKITEQFGFASAEHVLSGRGVEIVYNCQTGTEKKAADIFAAACENDDASREAIDTSVEALAAYAGDLALVSLPLSGIYLIGGVARAMVPFFGTTFETAFTNKGRFSDFLEQIPVVMVDDDYLALHGCASRLNSV